MKTINENPIVHDMNSKIFRKDEEIEKLKHSLIDKDVEIKKLCKIVDDMEKSVKLIQWQNRSLDHLFSISKMKYLSQLDDFEKTIAMLKWQNRSLEIQHEIMETKYLKQITDLEIAVAHSEWKYRSIENEIKNVTLNPNLCLDGNKKFVDGFKELQQKYGNRLLFVSIFAAIGVIFASKTP